MKALLEKILPSSFQRTEQKREPVYREEDGVLLGHRLSNGSFEPRMDETPRLQR